MTPLQRDVYNMRRNGHSFRWIAYDLKISEERARDLYTVAKMAMQPTGALKELYREIQAQKGRGDVRRCLHNIRCITSALHFLIDSDERDSL